MLEDFTVETFAERIGETFRVETDVAIVEMRLVEVTEPGASRPSAGIGPTGRTPFSLVLLEAGREVLPQRIYAFDHDELGSFEIFIVPIGQDADGVRYEAVFT